MLKNIEPEIVRILGIKDEENYSFGGWNEGSGWLYLIIENLNVTSYIRLKAVARWRLTAVSASLDIFCL